jgi:hypothetical protein
MLSLLALMATFACDDKPASAPNTPKAASTPVATTSSPPQARPEPTRWSFDGLAAGTLPSGWIAVTGRWQVTEQNALRQVAENETRVFNLVLADARAKDLSLRVKVRAVSGKTDQGGGLVWRALDPKNYYIARYNPLEKNFRAYAVRGGTRTQLASADVELPGDARIALEVRMLGDHLEASINGKKYLDVRDTTFSGSGAIGLWTKADAVTEFDDLELEQWLTNCRRRSVARASAPWRADSHRV